MKRNKSLLSKAQQDFILSELGSLRIDRYNYPKKPMPPAIREIKSKIAMLYKRVRAYDSAQEKSAESARKRRDREIAAVRKEVLFGTPESALRMLEELQRKSSNRK